MSSSLNKESKLVLKLDLGEDGVRRIPLPKLWDDAHNIVSHARLVELIMEIKNIKLKAVQNGRVTVCTTYTDEDGDEITISSDEELQDAFQQFACKTPPVLRAKAVLVKKKVGSGNKRERENAPEVIDTSVKRDKEKEMEIPVPPVPISASVDVGNKPLKKVTGTMGYNPSEFDTNFIHGRHTCDGCLTTPIFGIRYHASNLPDYDLCSACRENYKGTGIIFQPMQLDRDRHLQTRWQRRYNLMRKFTCPGDRAINKNQVKNIQETQMDSALKEAIRRSLIDAYPKKSEKEESVKTGSNAPETEPLVPPADEKEEPSVEEPQAIPIVEISAGNTYTQKVLDSMDLELKESLSCSLNKCFGGTTKCDKSTSSKSNEEENDCKKILDLTPDTKTEETIELMDEATKEEIRRSLNDFFFNRIHSDATSVTSKDEIRHKLDEFLASRLEKKNMKADLLHGLSEFFSKVMVGKDDVKEDDVEKNSSKDDDGKKVQKNIETVVVDIVMDHDALSGVTEDNQVSDAHRSDGVDVDDGEDMNPNMSEGSAPKDEWQMVTEDEEMIAVAAQMLGSALFQSDTSLTLDSNKR